MLIQLAFQDAPVKTRTETAVATASAAALRNRIICSPPIASSVIAIARNCPCGKIRGYHRSPA